MAWFKFRIRVQFHINTAEVPLDSNLFDECKQKREDFSCLPVKLMKAAIVTDAQS